MEILTEAEVRAIREVTDALGLDWNHVVVPLAAREGGLEMILPDGKLLIRAPAGPAFGPWRAGLRERLERMDLGRTPRA